MYNIEELDASDEEFERLEEIRRHGIPSNKARYDGDNTEDDDVNPYYTLPPSRVEVMQGWQEWRMVINDLMIDTSLNQNDFDAKRDVLTSSGISKTPDFFQGKNSIHGNRVKDEYGGEAITETDDGESKVTKKIMEENFYLFGIPRISVRRCSSEFNPGISGFRRHSVAATSLGDGLISSLSVKEQRRGTGQVSTSNSSSSNETIEPKIRHYPLGSKPKSSKQGFFKNNFLKASQKPPLPPRRRFSTGNL